MVRLQAAANDVSVAACGSVEVEGVNSIFATAVTIKARHARA